MANTTDTPEQLRPQARPDDLPTQEDEAIADGVPATATGPARPEARPVGLAEVPEGVRDAATDLAQLSLDGLALIGLFNGPDGGAALVRLPTGSIVKVSQGESVDGGRVSAISEDRLRLQKDGREIVLTMPS